VSILHSNALQLVEHHSEKHIKKVFGRTDLEDALKRLDKLTHDEARMATAEVLKATHTVDERVAAVDNRVAGVDNRVIGIGDRVKDVDDKVVVVINRAQTTLCQSPNCI